MLAIALVLEGSDRRTAAKSCGMGGTFRDRVHRYNAEGVAGLVAVVQAAVACLHAGVAGAEQRRVRVGGGELGERGDRLGARAEECAARGRGVPEPPATPPSGWSAWPMRKSMRSRRPTRRVIPQVRLCRCFRSSQDTAPEAVRIGALGYGRRIAGVPHRPRPSARPTPRGSGKASPEPAAASRWSCCRAARQDRLGSLPAVGLVHEGAEAAGGPAGGGDAEEGAGAQRGDRGERGEADGESDERRS